MSVRVSVNGTDLAGRAEQAAQAATRAVMLELFNACQSSLAVKAWDWPGQTQRRVGTVGSPRNIIDIGNLRQTGSWELNGYRATFRWSANYATAVHDGYRRFRKDGSYSTWPARPWTAAVLGRVNVPGIRPFPIEQRLRDVWIAKFRASQG